MAAHEVSSRGGSQVMPLGRIAVNYGLLFIDGRETVPEFRDLPEYFGDRHPNWILGESHGRILLNLGTHTGSVEVTLIAGEPPAVDHAVEGIEDDVTISVPAASDGYWVAVNSDGTDLRESTSLPDAPEGWYRLTLRARGRAEAMRQPVPEPGTEKVDLYVRPAPQAPDAVDRQVSGLKQRLVPDDG